MGRFHVKKLSKSTAVVLAGIIWTALVSFPITAKAQSSNGEASLKKFLQGYFAPKDEDKKTRYIAAFHDLNGDGTPEALVYISGPGWCGSGGCKLYVLTPAGSSWTIVARTTITWPPIRVLASRSHGWHNLAVSVGGGGIQPGYEAELRFDGKKYPGNPSAPPARRAAKNAPGTVVISETQKEKALFP